MRGTVSLISVEKNRIGVPDAPVHDRGPDVNEGALDTILAGALILDEESKDWNIWSNKSEQVDQIGWIFAVWANF
jgi:hypothetical protein